jgi:hypothetical protein
VTVAPRYALLAVGAAFVLGVSIYLFFQVRARPAQAQAPERGVAAPGVKQPALELDAEEDLEPQVPRETPEHTPPGRGEDPAPPRRVPRKPPQGSDGAPEDPAPQKLDALMNEANKAYDRGELDDARAIARKALRSSPNNARMLRIVVSASCIAGDSTEAQAAYAQLPQPDREQMKTRCARYGVSFTDP